MLTESPEGWRILWWVFTTIMMASLLPAFLVAGLLAEDRPYRRWAALALAVGLCYLLTLRLLKAVIVVVTELQEERR